MHANGQGASPLPAAERVPLLDIVRGFALLGILIMNLPTFVSSFFVEADGSHLWSGWHDQAVETVRNMLFDGKFNSMFSLLFGLGFTIQLARLAERSPGDATRIYLRRLMVLFLIGLVHAVLLWNGDVLHMYALLGLLLLALRNASDRTIIVLIALALLFPPMSAAVRMLGSTPELVAARVAELQAWEASNNLAYGAGSYLDSVCEHIRQQAYLYVGSVRNAIFTVGLYCTFGATVLLGFLVGRHRWHLRAAEYLPTIRKLQWWSLGLGLACAAVFGAVDLLERSPGPSLAKLAATLAYVLCRPLLMMFYVFTIVRLAMVPTWQKRLSAFEIAGRMPLTNYLAQSLIASVLFYGWGLGLWLKMGPALQLPLAFAIFFLLQVPLSRWWLARFAHGPMEWLWRYATYGRRPVGRLAPAGAGAVAASG